MKNSIRILSLLAVFVSAAPVYAKTVYFNDDATIQASLKELKQVAQSGKDDELKKMVGLLQLDLMKANEDKIPLPESAAQLISETKAMRLYLDFKGVGSNLSGNANKCSALADGKFNDKLAMVLAGTVQEGRFDSIPSVVRDGMPGQASVPTCANGPRDSFVDMMSDIQGAVNKGDCRSLQNTMMADLQKQLLDNLAIEYARTQAWVNDLSSKKSAKAVLPKGLPQDSVGDFLGKRIKAAYRDEVDQIKNDKQSVAASVQKLQKPVAEKIRAINEVNLKDPTKFGPKPPAMESAEYQQYKDLYYKMMDDRYGLLMLHLPECASGFRSSFVSNVPQGSGSASGDTNKNNPAVRMAEMKAKAMTTKWTLEPMCSSSDKLLKAAKDAQEKIAARMRETLATLQKVSAKGASTPEVSEFVRQNPIIYAQLLRKKPDYFYLDKENSDVKEKDKCSEYKALNYCNVIKSWNDDVKFHENLRKGALAGALAGGVALGALTAGGSIPLSAAILSSLALTGADLGYQGYAYVHAKNERDAKERNIKQGTDFVSGIETLPAESKLLAQQLHDFQLNMGLGVAGFAVGDIGLSMPQLLKMRSLYKAGTRFNELAELARQGKANSERLKALERILGNMDQKKVDMLAHLAAKKESMSGLRLVVADAIKDGKIKVSSEEALSALVTRLADDAVESKMSKQALDDLMLKVDANLKSNPAFKNKMAQLSACSVEADPCKCISQKGL